MIRPIIFFLRLIVSGAGIPALSAISNQDVSAAGVSEQTEAKPARLATKESQPVGAVEGVVTFHGEIPKSPIADDAGVRRDLLEVDNKTLGLRYVVTHLVRSDASAPQQPTSRSSVSSEGQHATVDQQNYAFTPRVVAVRAGQPVTFTNSDPANHNVRTSSPVAKDVFNVFTGVGGKYEHRFAADPELRPVRLGCDIHPWMRGWIYVFDHPYFAVTDERGRFRIGSVPPGRYKLILRQPDIRDVSEREVTVSAETAAEIEINVRPRAPAKPDE